MLNNLWFIASVALVVTLVGLAYAYLAKPIYQSNILIQVEESIPSARSIPGDLSSAFDLKVDAKSEMEVLRSRMVVGRAVDTTQLSINVQPKYFPGIGAVIARYNKRLSEPGLLGYGGYVWGTERAQVSLFDVPPTLQGTVFTLTAGSSGRYRLTQEEKGIAIEGEVGRPITASTTQGNIILRVDQLEAKAGAEFLLTRVPRLVMVQNLQSALQIEEKSRQSGIIGVALEGTDPKRTTAVLQEIGREYIHQNEDRKSEAAEKTLAILDRQMPQLKQELEASEEKYNEVRKKHGTVDLGEEGKGLLQQSVVAQTKMMELRQRKEELLVRYENEHPLVESVNQQVRALNRDMAAINARIKRLPEVEQDVVRLSRDVHVNRDVYTAVLSTAQQLRLATASKAGNVHLLDPPDTPVAPIKPKRRLVVLLAAAAGIVIGVAAALLRKNLGGRVDDPNEIEQLLGLNVCATIPHCEISHRSFEATHSEAKEMLRLPYNARSGNVVESLLGFHSSLPLAMACAKNNIIMFTGPTPGVGKSFVAANFSTVLGAMGKRVLLIDGDLRTGHLHQYFGVSRRHGLTDAIYEETLLEQVITRGVAENLDFVSTGELPARPAYALAHQNFGKLLKQLAARYDLVLIDTPPVLAVADALTVALHAGAIFNIVRGGVSTVWEIEETVKRLSLAGATLTGTVFNDAKSHSARYRYGYGYGYRYESTSI